MEGHARLGPSNHRWPHCPGSVREEAAYPNISGDAAIDGTGSHLLLEICMIDPHPLLKLDKLVGTTIGIDHPDKPGGWMVDKERADRVMMCINYIGRRGGEIDGCKIEAESKSNPGFYFKRNDWWGTCDITLTGTDTLEVIDYKDGRMYVDVKDNTQLMSYAFGKLAPFIFIDEPDFGSCPFKNVRMTIVQPKTNTPVRYVDVTPEEVWARGVKLSVAAEATDDPNAPLIEGKHCTWCKHGRAGNCTAKTQKAMEALEAVTTITDKGTLLEAIQAGSISPGTMTNDQLASFMDATPLINQMIKQVEDEIASRLDDGQSVPHYAWGTGRSSKKWIDDPEIVAKKLKGMRFKKDELYPAKLISPTAALKHPTITDRQKANIEKMIQVVEGKKKVVSSNTIEKSVSMFDTVPVSFM